jgi:SAM-dependent methyltransferase
MNLGTRSRDEEWMDTVPVPPGDFASCLGDLGRVNLVTRAQAPTLAFLRRAARDWPRGRPLRVLDVGSGGGDMLRRIARWGRRRGQALDLVGLDLHPHSTLAAEAATPPGLPIRYVTGDVFALDPAQRFDLILSSLFTHHLADTDVVRFLRFMEERAGRGWFVNDLHRHALALQGFRLLSWAAGWHRFVRHDGAVSVRRAFRVADWRALLAEAGIEGARLRWFTPFRLCVERIKAKGA